MKLNPDNRLPFFRARPHKTPERHLWGCGEIHFDARGRLCNGRSGFSIAELMLVVAIAGLMVSLAAPILLRSLGRSNTDFAADEFMSRFSSARSYAISRNTYSRFIMDPANNSYRIKVYDPATLTWQDVEQIFHLPEGISFAEGITFPGMAATFDPYGSLDYGGEVALVDQSGYSVKMKAFIANGQLNRTE